MNPRNVPNKSNEALSRVHKLAMNAGHVSLPVMEVHLICKAPRYAGLPAKDLIPISLATEDPVKVTFIGASLEEPLRGKLVRFLQENSDVFAWSATDMPGIDPELITHKLNVDPN
ncbi:hypothetical protein AgCh_018007 [Apium graveolens]